VPADQATPPTPSPEQPKRAPVHYLWAVLIARIYEVFRLMCPIYGGQMHIITFITHSAEEGTQIEPDWDLATQPEPDYEVDQRVNW
jgi:hypothetical protein